jgi:integrase
MAIRKRRWVSRGVERTAWIADYVDQHGDRHIRTFRTKKDADAWMAAARHEIGQGLHTAASRAISVSEAMQRWIEHSEREGLEYGTIRQRRQHLNLHVEPFIGSLKLSDLTLPRIHQFNDQLRDAGRSPAMRRKVMSNLGTAISNAMAQGLVAQNVVRNFKMRRDDRETGGPLRAGVDFPTKAELRAILDNVVDRHRAFIAVLIFTGMRISEVRGLRWSDVDIETGVIHVRQRADAWARIAAPKTKAGSRDIPLVPMTVNALRAWRLQCPKGELDLVFPNSHGRVQTRANLSARVFMPLQKAAGIAKPYGFHALRHAAASLFIEHLGWQPKQLQHVMGHSSIKMTFDRYGHLFTSPQAGAEAMKRLEAAILAG